MLRIVVVDLTAEARTQLTELVTNAFSIAEAETTLLPQISLKSMTFEELRFHGAADLVVLGPETIQRDLTLVGAARKMLPEIPLIVRVPESFARLPIIEQIARFGADDVWLPSTSSVEILRKLIILSRRSRTAKSGRLILVDSGKGGAGVTSLVAALGDALAQSGRRTLLVDCDVDSQDLTRFLQVKPHINENLQQLLDGQRPLTQEFVEQSVVQVWSDVANLFCLPPPTDGEKLVAGVGSVVRLYLSVLEVLDNLFSCVIVDAGSARGPFLRTLYRVADVVVFPVSNDPAALFVAADRIARARAHIAPDAEIRVFDLLSQKGGMSHRVMLEELRRSTRLSDIHFSNAVVPHTRQGQRWPASGATLYGCGGRAVRQAIELFCSELGLTEGSRQPAARAAQPNLAIDQPSVRLALPTSQESVLSVDPNELIDAPQFEDDDGVAKVA